MVVLGTLAWCVQTGLNSDQWACLSAGPSEAVVDPQESGNSGQILFSAVFLKLSPSPWFISEGAVLQKHSSLDKL